MEIYLDRKGSGQGPDDVSTIGELFVEDVSVVTLEDDLDKEKNYAHTRIPDGRYEIKFRKEGTHHEKYKVRFPEIHKGMLHLQDVPNYKHILIHCGNTPDDTAGCILVGMKAVGPIKIEGSTKAYKLIYPLIAGALESGERVYINIKA
jgi:hypothetical protein